MKKLFLSIVAFCVTCSMFVASVSAATTSSFKQNTETNNTYGYVDPETDQFETYSTVEGSTGQYTSLSSKIYKPNSGDTLIVCFHGNGEGAVDGNSNNYSQIAANQMATTFIDPEIQAKYNGAYVLAFQAPDYWYNDYTEQAKAIIDQAKQEFGIKQVFVTGLSAGGLMTERMVAKYGSYFSGALISCAAISKNNQYVEGLGGDYSKDYEGEDPFLNEDLGLKKPADYVEYKDNYLVMLNAMAESGVPMYLVHCTNDNTISVEWSRLAYNTIKEIRTNNNIPGDIYFQEIESTGTNKDTGATLSTHWAWVKMYNNEIETSVARSGVKTMDWFTELSTSENAYTEKTSTVPTAGASGEENTYLFNLIGEVREDGEKVVALEIDMNGKKVDASKLTKEMFKVKAYNTDAQTDVNSEVNYGIFGSEEEPVELEVASVEVNERGNIVIKFDGANRKAVLNWSGTVSRNLTTNMRYSIDPVELPIVEEPVVDENKNETKAPVATKTEDKKVTSVKTGDDTSFVLYGMMVIASASLFVFAKKRSHN